MAANWLTEEEETLQDALAEAGFGEGESVSARIYQIHTNDVGGKLRGSFCFELGPMTLDEVGDCDVEAAALAWATENMEPGPHEFQVTFRAGKTRQSRRFSVVVPKAAAQPEAGVTPEDVEMRIKMARLEGQLEAGGGSRREPWTAEQIAALVGASASALASIGSLFKGSGGHDGPSVTELLSLMEAARTNGLKLGEELGESKASAPTGATPLDLGIAALNKLPETIGQLVAARAQTPSSPRPAVRPAQPPAPALAEPAAAASATPPEAAPASELDPTPEESETMFFQLRMTKLVNLLVDALEKAPEMSAEAVLDLVDQKLTARDRDTLADLVEQVGVPAACEFLGGQLAATRPEGVRHVGEGGTIRAALGLLVSADGAGPSDGDGEAKAS